jgi:DNA-binding NtrC family response regulator
VLTRTDTITAQDRRIGQSQHQLSKPQKLGGSDLPSAVAKVEVAMIQRALELCDGNRAEAARLLNINRQLLYAKIERYGLANSAASEKPTHRVGKADD